MMPANESLEAGDLVAREIDHRLVVEFELAAGERLAQIAFQRAARLHLRVHLPLEEAERAAPIALGAIEGKIGVAQDLDLGSFRPPAPQRCRCWRRSPPDGPRCRRARSARR